MKKITVIGGGTGTFVVLTGLKKYPYELGAIVTMMDSGGSTGRLRDQLGVLPPGDLRQCLVALSDAPILWRKLFLYRFESGDLRGHNFGNLFLSALEKVSDNYDEVVKSVSYVLKIKGKVMPVTFSKVDLGVKYQSGKTIIGENNIEENVKEKSRIESVFLSKPAVPNPAALKHLKKSDIIILGPGDLFTSIIPVLLVNRVRETLQECRAKIIFVMNLMTKSGQTNNFKASDHLAVLTKYLGKQPDIIVLNNQTIPQNILNWYDNNNERQVINDLSNHDYQGRIIQRSIIDDRDFVQNMSDRLTRSILRHNPDKLAEVLTGLI